MNYNVNPDYPSSITLICNYTYANTMNQIKEKVKANDDSQIILASLQIFLELLKDDPVYARLLYSKINYSNLEIE